MFVMCGDCEQRFAARRRGVAEIRSVSERQ